MKSILRSMSLGLCVALLACNHPDDGEKFVGKWERFSGNGLGVVIERNGEHFIVSKELPAFVGGVMKLDAVREGIALKIDLGIASELWTIDPKTGHLIRPGEELERVGA